MYSEHIWFKPQITLCSQAQSLTYQCAQCAFLTSLVEFKRNTCTLLRSGILFLLQTVLNVSVRAPWQGPQVTRTAFYRQCGLLFTFQTGYSELRKFEFLPHPALAASNRSMLPKIAGFRSSGPAHESHVIRFSATNAVNSLAKGRGN